MSIVIANKRNNIINLQKKYPSAFILDITSKSPYEELRMLSPFYPHGNIPIPGMKGKTATCVEAIWQGLKVFESCGVDYDLFNNDSMHNLKRTVRKYGKPLGHQLGNSILNYPEARFLIYLPTYKYVLDNIPPVREIVSRIRKLAKTQSVVFLDYNTNCNVFDFSKPLSHAALVKLHIEDNYPTLESYNKWEHKNNKTCEKTTKSHSNSGQLTLFD